MLLFSASVSAQTVAVQVSIPVQTTFTINGITMTTTGSAVGTIYVPDTTGTGNTQPPSGPTVNPNAYGYGGQSNMTNTVPFFIARVKTMRGFAEGAQPISYWDVGANGWTQLNAAIAGHSELRAFIWFQGETDNGGDMATYTAKLVNLISRVRLSIGTNLEVFLTLLNPQYVGSNGAIASACAQIANCALIHTADLEWAADNIHLDNVGADAYVVRVITTP